MCENKCFEKKILRLKAKVEKLREQRLKMIKEVKRANKRKCPGKDAQEKAIGTISGETRDTECNDKWAAFTSVGLGLASTVIKQVGKLHFCQIMTQFQVNSILVSDKTLIKKKSKQDDFLEHRRILQQALTVNPCDVGNANGKPPTNQLCFRDFKIFQVYLTP